MSDAIKRINRRMSHDEKPGRLTSIMWGGTFQVPVVAEKLLEDGAETSRPLSSDDLNDDGAPYEPPEPPPWTTICVFCWLFGIATGMALMVWMDRPHG